MDHSQEVQTWLAQGMGPKLHWFPADVSLARLAAVLVGLANSAGGTVLLGVAPRSAQVLGVPDLPATLDLVFQAALLADPPLVLPLPRPVQVGQVQVLVALVPSGLPQVYSLDGRYLGRDGTQTNPLPARRLRALLMERGVIQFELQTPPGAGLDDLDWVKVDAYLHALELPGDVRPEEVLLRRGCLRPTVAQPAAPLQPTYAALLLFGKRPQQWLSSAGILAARFTGPTLADRFFRQEIHGTLPEQLRQAEAFVRDNVRRVVRLEGLERTETLEYPVEAVRELLVNAVAHRDYNIQGDLIHLNLFSDRLEVHSPGGLPGPVTLQNLLEARFSRNAVIMQVLSDMGFVERLGYGLNRVVAALLQAGLRQPEFSETAGTFRVTLFGGSDLPPALPDLQAYQDLDLNPRQQRALAFLVINRRITNRDYQELCKDVHSETLRRDLVDLVERNLLVKIGDKRATYYILKK